MRTNIKTVLKKVLLFSFIVMLAFQIGTIDSYAASAAAYKVTPSSAIVNVGNTVTLKANKNTKWYISKGGKYIKLTTQKAKTLKVKGLAQGTAVVTAKAGSKIKKITIKVIPKLQVTPANKTINVGATVTLKSSNNAKWSITSGMGVVKFTSRTDKKATIKALKVGTAKVKIKDARTGVSKIVTIKVVPKLQVTPTNKTVEVNNTVTLQSNNDAKWSITSGTGVIKFTSRTGKKAIIKACGVGTAKVKVQDAKTGAYKTVTIKVFPELQVVPTDKTLEIDESVTLEANTNVKWSIVSGNDVIEFISELTKTATIKARKAGTAKVEAVDVNTGSVKYIQITVNAKPKKSLVIYFARGENIVDAKGYLDTLGDDIDAMTSASVLLNDKGEVTGNNGIVSEWIAEALGTKTYSIKVKDLYPQLKKETQKIVLNEEQIYGILPDVESCTEDLSQYDIIYLGFPNWYGEPPRAMYTFLKENNLDGKTIVPFTTHDKNGFSDAIDILKSMHPNSPVLEDGLVLDRKEVPNAKEATLEWLEKIRIVAEKAEEDPLTTVAGQKEAAMKLIGQTLTPEEVAAAVGQYAKFVTDTNG